MCMRVCVCVCCIFKLYDALLSSLAPLTCTGASERCFFQRKHLWTTMPRQIPVDEDEYARRRNLLNLWCTREKKGKSKTGANSLRTRFRKLKDRKDKYNFLRANVVPGY